MTKIHIKQLNRTISIEKLISNLKVFDSDIIYLSGSLIEGKVNIYSKGMGNKYSDIDVFIIRAPKEFESTQNVYDYNYKKVDLKKIDGINYDIEIFDLDYIKEITESLDNINLTLNTRIGNSINLPDNTSHDDVNGFLNRFVNSIVIKNLDSYNIIKNKLEIDKWISLQKYFYINAIENGIEDIVGNMEANQLGVAMLCMQKTFLDFLKYVILFNRDLIDRDKWIPLKIANIAEQNELFLDVIDQHKFLFYSEKETVKMKKKVIQSSLNFVKNKIEELELEELI